MAIYGIENHAGAPVYVHAKTCIVDDTWATIGSDNFNRRSWTHDSELSAVVLDPEREFARDLRLALAAEHLDRDAQDPMDDCVEARRDVPRRTPTARPPSTGGTPAAGSDRGRPAGCAASSPPELGRVSRALALAPYLWVHDPDGRPKPLRRRDAF